MSAEDKSSSAASSSSLALPAELLLRVCLCLEAVDVLRLGVVERRAVDVCRSDAVWRRLYNLRFRRKAVVPDDRLLGASFLRMYRQEIFAKALSHMGKTLEVAAHRGMALDAVGPCDLHDESKLVIYLRGGQIRVHSLALEGQQIGAAHLVENASSIRAEEEREERRQDLSAAHKNALLQFKISHARLATAEPQACSASSASGTSIGSDPLCTATSAPGLGIKLASSTKSSKPSQGEEKVLIATGHANGAILLWGQACTFLGAIDAASDKAVRILAVRGQRVAAASATGVAVWEVPSARKIANMPTDGAVEAIQMLDEIIVAGTARGGVHIWTRAGRSVFTARDTHDGPVTCLRCLTINEANTPLGADNVKGGPSFVVASAGGSSHEIVLRRFKEQQRECLLRGRDLQCDMTRVLRGHAGAVRDLYMDSYRIVSCGDDGTIKFWDAEDAETRVVRSVKFKRAKHRAPLTQLIVGTSFVAASRGNGGLVAFTLLSDWADLAPAEPSTRAQVTDAGEASAGGLPSTDATPRNDYLEMLFEETFDVYDLQEAHDLLNYGFASR
ncbi:F-box/WD repeat-containing protein 7 [Hondaea fermentalgiana]|uniref:F-box/WD repeat-containing protein 7 n=1 Tax=Hondaea fermentalgiana TaxID=2315210 RepID=A0A2R5GZI4_9STRA|nr:F-box/WD repeat-containing protein 7 [Hondaea fermentalgiana]|eukprot:GBG33891.1 F-box/WD repeat-containing protein 7 [Hondaea fermentalgiana]